MILNLIQNNMSAFMHYMYTPKHTTKQVGETVYFTCCLDGKNMVRSGEIASVEILGGMQKVKILCKNWAVFINTGTLINLSPNVIGLFDTLEEAQEYLMVFNLYTDFNKLYPGIL